MVFCAYCGKSFTRKEHLERHIPSHTNVKPHRCSACQLSFARRDLLQRHHATYHEARDPMESLPGGGIGGSGTGVSTVAGRTPIACQNCANAKTGCDKRVPCARCAEKSLPCAARFARRSSKAVGMRGSIHLPCTSASAGVGDVMRATPQQPMPDYVPLQQVYYHGGGSNGAPLSFSAVGAPLTHDLAGAGRFDDMYLAADPAAVGLLQQPLPSPPPQADGPFVPTPYHGDTPLDAFVGFGNGSAMLDGGGGGYQDLNWSDYPMMDMDISSNIDMSMDFDLERDCVSQYANPLHLSLADAAPVVAPSTAPTAPTAPMAPDPFLVPAAFTTPPEQSDVSSGSEPATVSSSWESSSMHTRGTSILSWSGSGGDDSSGGEAYGGFGSACGNKYGDMGLFLPPQSVLPLLKGTACSTGLAFGVDGSPLMETVEQVEKPFAAPIDAAIAAAEAAWPIARCTPAVFADACPPTTLAHLERLQKQLCELQSPLETAPQRQPPDDGAATDRPVVALTQRACDTLLAVTWRYLQRALARHQADASRADNSPPVRWTLPPPGVLDALLRRCVRTLEIQYFDPLFFAGRGGDHTVDPNAILLENSGNATAPQLLALGMLAHGAAAPGSPLPALAAGLAETGRLALADLLETDAGLRSDPTALCCALLGTVVSAWSGDTWQMDRAVGARGAYLMHSGMLEPQPSTGPLSRVRGVCSPALTALQWKSWRQREAQNRWVLADQELSLLYDTAPVLAVGDLHCPLPAAAALWHAPTAECWWRAAASESAAESLEPPSLHELFRAFLRHDDHDALGHLPLHHLRLLLYPLQIQVSHLRQTLACLPEDEDDGETTDAHGGLPPARPGVLSSRERCQEIEGLLQHWHDLATLSLSLAISPPPFPSSPSSPSSQHSPSSSSTAARCTFVLYHLVALNAVTDFPAIERLARRTAGASLPSSHRCITEHRRAAVHCRQVLRLLRQLPADDDRPAWWSVALYRAVLVLWADSVLHGDETETDDDDDDNVVDRDGVPHTPEALLRYGVAQLDDTAGRTPLADGIRRKLLALGQRWEEAGGRDEGPGDDGCTG